MKLKYLLEVVTKLPAPEKSKILRPVDRVAIGDPGHNLVRRWGEGRPQKGDFAAADSFAGCLTSYIQNTKNDLTFNGESSCNNL